MSEWVIVKNALPKFNTKVLIYDENSNEMEIATLELNTDDYYQDGYNQYLSWVNKEFFSDIKNPTHWMPLPNPPKEEV
jgi:hypothetical protein